MVKNHVFWLLEALSTNITFSVELPTNERGARNPADQSEAWILRSAERKEFEPWYAG